MAASNPAFADPRLAFANTIYVEGSADTSTPAPRATPRPCATPTVSTRPAARKRSSWWGLMLCGLVAGFFSGAAILASPLGDRPALQRFTTAVTSLTSAVR